MSLKKLKSLRESILTESNTGSNRTLNEATSKLRKDFNSDVTGDSRKLKTLSFEAFRDYMLEKTFFSLSKQILSSKETFYYEYNWEEGMSIDTDDLSPSKSWNYDSYSDYFNYKNLFSNMPSHESSTIEAEMMPSQELEDKWTKILHNKALAIYADLNSWENTFEKLYQKEM